MRFAYETLEAATDARASATTADDAAAQPQEGMTIPNDQELDPLAPDAGAVSPIAPGTIRLESFLLRLVSLSLLPAHLSIVHLLDFIRSITFQSETYMEAVVRDAILLGDAAYAKLQEEIAAIEEEPSVPVVSSSGTAPAVPTKSNYFWSRMKGGLSKSGVNHIPREVINDEAIPTDTVLALPDPEGDRTEQVEVPSPDSPALSFRASMAGSSVMGGEDDGEVLFFPSDPNGEDNKGLVRSTTDVVEGEIQPIEDEKVLKIMKTSQGDNTLSASQTKKDWGSSFEIIGKQLYLSDSQELPKVENVVKVNPKLRLPSSRLFFALRCALLVAAHTLYSRLPLNSDRNDRTMSTNISEMPTQSIEDNTKTWINAVAETIVHVGVSKDGAIGHDFLNGEKVEIETNTIANEVCATDEKKEIRIFLLTLLGVSVCTCVKILLVLYEALRTRRAKQKCAINVSPYRGKATKNGAYRKSPPRSSPRYMSYHKDSDMFHSTFKTEVESPKGGWIEARRSARNHRKRD